MWYAMRRYAAYRFGALSEAVTNTVFCFLTQALIGPVQIFGGMELTERIRTGDVAIDLYRPADLQGWWLADDLGRAAFALAFRGLPPLLTGILVFHLGVPGPATWARF